MNKIYFLGFFMLFGSYLKAQERVFQTQISEGNSISNEFKKVNSSNSVLSRSIKSTDRNSSPFVAKATNCIDTLSYPYLKQYLIDQNEFYYYEINNGTYGQVFKTGLTNLTVDKVEIPLAKQPADQNNTVTLEVSIYSIDATNKPTTLLRTTNYVVPDTSLAYRTITLPTAATINNNYGFAVTLKTVESGKRIKAIINDPTVSSYDEELSYFGTGATAVTMKSALAGSSPSQVGDFDFVVIPHIKHVLQTPTLTVSPLGGCVNSSVNLNTTTTPADIASNRFLNYYAFVNHFNFNTNNYTFVHYPNVSITSNYLIGNNVNHTYTTAGTYDAGVYFELGFTTEACYEIATQQITISDLPNTTFTYPNTSMCVSSSDQTPTVGSVGGTFSSTPTGLSIDVNTGKISPGLSTPGVYNITYTKTNGNCTTTSTATQISVTTTPTATFNYGQTSYCTNDVNPTAVIAPNSTSGVFTSVPNGVQFLANGTINLASSQAGNYTIMNTIEANGACPAVQHPFAITIRQAPNAQLNIPSTICLDVVPLTLSATPAGGVFSGTYVSNGTLDLTQAGVGTHAVTYTAVENGCTSTDTKSIVISNTAFDASFSYNATSYCYNGSNPVLTLNSGASIGNLTATPNGLGLNTNTGQITLSNSRPGTYVVTNTIATVGQCLGDQHDFTITIDTLGTINIVTVTPKCITESALTLNATPANGTFSGNGVTGIDFSPALAGAGSHTITYTVSSGVCTKSETMQISVSAVVPVAFSAPTSLCSDAASVLLSATPSGGTFSGNGVVNGQFNPATAGAGNHTIVYSVMNGACSLNESSTIQVVAIPEITFVAPAVINPVELCVQGTTYGLTATPAGGTFSGTGVTGTNFSAQTAGIGSHIITYTYSNSGCSSSKQATIQVNGCLSVEENLLNNIRVYPNPTNAFIYVSSPENATMELLSVDGKLIRESILLIGGQETELDVQNLAKGSYLIKISSESIRKIERIVIQ